METFGKPLNDSFNTFGLVKVWTFEVNKFVLPIVIETAELAKKHEVAPCIKNSYRNQTMMRCVKLFLSSRYGVAQNYVLIESVKA